MNFKLRDFQIEGVRRIYGFHGRALLADDQGLGKTVQSLRWIQLIPKRRPVLIVAPSSVKYNWKQEAWDKFRMRARVLEGRGPRNGPIHLRDEILVLNFDILPAWLPSLKLNPPKVLIIDEGHYLCNRTSKRTRAAKEVADKADSVVVLTGTPLTNEAVQLWSILNIVKPRLFPSFKKYTSEYTKPKLTHWGWVYKGSKNRKKLHKILVENVMIRRLKEDVAKELPPKIHRMIPVHLDGKEAREYKRAKEEFLIWLKSWSPGRAARAKRAVQMAKVGYLMRLCARLRLPATCEFIKDFSEDSPEEQLVGLTGHTFVIDHLEKEFDDCVVVDGKHTGQIRHIAIRKFTARRCQYFWGNWTAAGAGLNLQTAHNLIALDPPWTPGTRNQGMDRIHRIGQTKQVIISHLFAMGTIEEVRMKILDTKSREIANIVDGKSGDESDYNLLDELLLTMKKES